MIDPWRMWGSTQTIELPGSATPISQTSGQIANIDSHYPTSWGFFLACQLQYDGTVLPSNSVFVDFILTFGVGRSTVILDPFVRFDFSILNNDFVSRTSRFCTQVQAYAPSEFHFNGVPTASNQTANNIIDAIPASNIQLNARLTPTGPLPVGSLTSVQCSGFFAPKTHVRPDWFNGKFASELGGN
jgi:hypothetical protein